MSETVVAAEPQIIEGPGRYKVFQTPDGGWLISRAGSLCDTCLNCGCGEQAEPIVLPPMVIKLAMSQGKGLLGKLKGLSGRG